MALQHLHVRFLRFSAFYAPLLLALEEERLAAAGLAATFDKVTPERTNEAGLRDGTVQVAQSATAVSFAPVLRGEVPVYRHFAVMNLRDGLFLAARDRAEPFSWKSLEGRSVLVDHFFQPLALFRTALRLQGVDASRVTFVDAGDPAGIEAAFREGRGDFFHMQGPVPQQMEEEGLCRVVAMVGEATGDLAFSTLCARPEWLQTEVARAFMGVFRKARADAQRTEPSALAARLAPFLPGSSVTALAATLGAYQRMGTWTGDERLTPALYDRTVQVFREVGSLASTPDMSEVVAAFPE
ncbi:MAG: ABC transporter substrate-binding protein [Deltaproteobacteria bacterium]|nr:ABC transporter substrate-binding protein [Deltaproteobacteria bacterium]